MAVSPRDFVGAGTNANYRMVDFRRDKLEIVGKVAALEYDPNRTARICPHPL